MNQIQHLQDALAQLQWPTNTMTTEQSVERLIGIYEEANSLKSTLDGFRKEVKDLLTEIITETGQMKWDTPSGQCYITAPSVSVRYDPKSLDVLMASDWNIERMLSPFRTETERPGMLTIRAAKR
jgi:hypothetical protein